MDLEVPRRSRAFRGPKFGIEGTRKLTGVQNRPIIGTIIKPSIGLSPARPREFVQTLARPGSTSSRTTS
jgi:ribulose-bisphosphate carboxylase large chain